MNSLDFIYRVAIWICVIVNFASGSVRSQVRCSDKAMEVDIVRSSPTASIYLEHLKNYPDEACKPKLTEGVATFRLSLLDEGMLRCGVTRVVNTVTGQKVYYHKVVIEDPATETPKTIFNMQCIVTEVSVPRAANGLAGIHRRSLPENFTEAEVFNITQVDRAAPVPILTAGVRQGGALVTGELNVSPGTPLQMEIYLDPVSAPVYGILTTHMQVSDMRNQEETIIFNGCSVDPYLFENFNTINGDFLSAKFRAFKFPESNYVQFRATVNICVEKCEGIQCSNDQVGYGRKRRAISSPTGDKASLYEVTMSTLIKVDFDGGAETDEALLEFVRGWKNHTEDRPAIAKEVREQYAYSVIKETENETSGSVSPSVTFSIVILCLCLFQVL